jgi:hypothetical protein
MSYFYQEKKVDREYYNYNINAPGREKVQQQKKMANKSIIASTKKKEEKAGTRL